MTTDSGLLPPQRRATVVGGSGINAPASQDGRTLLGTALIAIGVLLLIAGALAYAPPEVRWSLGASGSLLAGWGAMLMARPVRSPAEESFDAT